MQGDNVLAREILVADQILPILGFDVKPLNRIPGKDVAGVLERDQVGIVGEDFVRDGVDILVIVVLCKVEFDKVCRLERRAVDGVRSMLLQPRQDVGEVECRSLVGAHWMLEGLQREGAEVEGQSLERTRGILLVHARACAGRWTSSASRRR